MNIEDSIKTLKEFNKIKINSYAMQFVNISYPDLQEAIETLLTAYEKEKEKNKELEETKNKLVRYIAIKEGKDYEQVCREFEI